METAIIKFLPVCSECGQVVKDKIEAIPTTYSWEPDISPTRCPACGRIFVGVEMPAKLPFDNRPTEYLINEKMEVCDDKS